MNHNISIQEFEQIMSMMKWLPATQRRSVAPVINKLKETLFSNTDSSAKKINNSVVKYDADSYCEKFKLSSNEEKALETCFDEALGTPRKDKS